MGAIYEVYIDVLAVNNFFVDLAALLAVNLFQKRRVRAYRILGGAAFGTFGSCLAFVMLHNFAVYLLVVHILVHPAALFLTFGEKSKQDFFSDLFTCYFFLMIIAGASQWLYEGGDGMFSIEVAVGTALFFLFFIVVWLCKQLKKRVRYLTAELSQDGKRIRLQAFADSGNLLTDPYTGKQVSMIDRRVYELSYGPPSSVRLVPYESLGCKHGLLEVVTIDELNYAYENRAGSLKKAVLGLADHALFENKPYQMIINPEQYPTGGKYEKDG